MMELFVLFITVVFTVGICEGIIWNSRRPVYVIERFLLPETNGHNLKFPLKTSGSAIPFEMTPLATVMEANKPSASALTSKAPESKSVTEPLPKLVKPIPTAHKVKIKALHPPCHKIGCMKGSQCVYDRMWLCPTYIPDLHCSCRPGCKVGTIFIPMGKVLPMDECGNQCACLDEGGEAVCTKRNCTKPPNKKEERMDSLLKYLKKLVKIKLQDREKSTERQIKLQNREKSTERPKPLQTSASGNVQHRKTTSKEINMSKKIDFPTETRFPYNPHRTRSFYVRAII